MVSRFWSGVGLALCVCVCVCVCMCVCADGLCRGLLWGSQCDPAVFSLPVLHVTHHSHLVGSCFNKTLLFLPQRLVGQVKKRKSPDWLIDWLTRHRGPIWCAAQSTNSYLIWTRIIRCCSIGFTYFQKVSAVNYVSKKRLNLAHFVIFSAKGMKIRWRVFVHKTFLELCSKISVAVFS